jgi:hypothetical protein
MTPRRPIGVRGGREVLAQSPLRFLLVAWDSCMASSRTILPVGIAAQVRVKLLEEDAKGPNT